MRKLFAILFLFLCCGITAQASYIDHRGHNVDSLETVMAGWSAARLADASESELNELSDVLEGLMWGYNQTNSVKSEHYARMLLRMAERLDRPDLECSAAKGIGQHFWAKDIFDSAAFYYGVAMNAAGKIEDNDDALSSLYGALGNLYSMMDSIGVAMDYYNKAGEIFKRHGWHNSSSVLYYNMGETMRYEGDFKKAEVYYLESLEYSRLAKDSLAVATAQKGLGSLYLEMKRPSRAMRCLSEANRYFAEHEKEELQFRMESLDYTGQVLALQKKHMTVIFVLVSVAVLLAGAVYLVIKRLRRTTAENREFTEIFETTIKEITAVPEKKDVSLKPKEREILSLIANGYTNAQIAEAMCLSAETIKWYKKKLFAIFDASNSAELISKVTEKGLL